MSLSASAYKSKMTLKNFSSSLELRAKTQNRNCVYVGLKIFGNIPGFPGGIVVKNPPANAGDAVRSLDWKIPWRRKWQPTPMFLSGKYSKIRRMSLLYWMVLFLHGVLKR